MCIQSIKELSAFKFTLIGVMQQEKDLVMKAMQRCFEMSDSWKVS